MIYDKKAEIYGVEFDVVVEYVKTRNGFNHVATMYKNGVMEMSVKQCYINRTWESFDGESAIKKIIKKWCGKNELLQNKMESVFIEGYKAERASMW